MKFLTPPRSKFLRHLLTMTALVLAFAILGTLMLWAVYSIPTERMDASLVSSAQTIHQEGSKPILFYWCTSMLDNYTDAWMLSIAGFDSGEATLRQAMHIPSPMTESGGKPATVFISRYVRNEPYTSYHGYSRYWHGYLVLLKPLLLFLNFNQIRFFNTAFQLILLGVLLHLMDKRRLKSYIPAFLISYLFLMPVAVMSSLQFSSCFYMMVLGCIALLLPEDAQYQEYAPYLFLLIGVVTVYIDFLTYPMVTLGIPAVLYCCRRNKMPIRTAFQEGLNICFSWGFGYVGMWASKWILGSLILQESIFESVSAQLSLWSSTDASQDTHLLSNILSAFSMNIKDFIYTPASVILMVYFLVLLFQILRKLRIHKHGKSVAVSCFPYAVLALVPLAWYCVTSNHAMVHTFFTNKNLMVSVFAVLCALVSVNAHLQPPAKK